VPSVRAAVNLEISGNTAFQSEGGVFIIFNEGGASTEKGSRVGVWKEGDALLLKSLLFPDCLPATVQSLLRVLPGPFGLWGPSSYYPGRGKDVSPTGFLPGPCLQGVFEGVKGTKNGKGKGLHSLSRTTAIPEGLRPKRFAAEPATAKLQALGSALKNWVRRSLYRFPV